MNKLSIRLLCQIYGLLVLLAATILSALPYSLLTLALLLVLLLITLRPLAPRFNVVITAATVFLMPLALEPLLISLTGNAGIPLRAGQIITASSILPILYILDCYLKQNAPDTTALITSRPKGRYLTTTARALLTSMVSILLLSLILNNFTLLVTSLTFALYLLGILIRVLLALPRLPLDIPTLSKRLIAGTTADIWLHTSSQSRIRLYGLLSPVDPWVRATPQRFTVDRDEIELNLTITPPLAGPSRPELQASVIDSRGLIRLNQLLQPVELQVIPRAKYAEWLATKYLERTGIGAAATTQPSPRAILPLKRGIEYFESRPYQPGDQLKNIDWKHTLKLNRLIVKEYIETGGQAAILAVNLSVTDAEEADKTAYNLITAALTLSQEAVPTALAAYNNQEVISATAILDPREILKRSLALVKDITPVELTHRRLQLPDLNKIRRDIAQLKQATSEPARRLLNMLDFEYQAIEKAAKNHPASLALSLATRQASTPAIIVLISQLNHDAEALMITTDRLSRRDFTTISVESKSRGLTNQITLTPR